MVEGQIWNLYFLFDNWTKLGSLYFITDSAVENEDVEVKDFTINGQWNTSRLQRILSENMVHFITGTITPLVTMDCGDKAWGINLEFLQ